MLLAKEGYRFEIIPSQATEIEANFANVADVVKENANRKGREVVDRLCQKTKPYPDPTVLLAADTLVAMGSRVFPKPLNLDQAHEFLATLGGCEHQVLTGVFLHHLQTGKQISFCEVSQVRLHALDRKARQTLFKRVNPLDKAGGYGSQDAPEIMAGLKGNLSTVIGLPTEALAISLTQLLQS